MVIQANKAIKAAAFVKAIEVPFATTDSFDVGHSWLGLEFSDISG